MVTAATLAALGHHVVGVDQDAEKIATLQAGHLPVLRAWSPRTHPTRSHRGPPPLRRMSRRMPFRGPTWCSSALAAPQGLRGGQPRRHRARCSGYRATPHRANHRRREVHGPVRDRPALASGAEARATRSPGRGGSGFRTPSSSGGSSGSMTRSGPTDCSSAPSPGEIDTIRTPLRASHPYRNPAHRDRHRHS